MDQKPPPTNKRIARQKKAQAAFSLTGGTLGLAALASRGQAARVGRVSSHLTRAGKKSMKAGKDFSHMADSAAAASQKWKDRSTALTTAGAGIGGVGAYNFASYTNAEAKKQVKMKKNADPFEINKAIPRVENYGGWYRKTRPATKLLREKVTEHAAGGKKFKSAGGGLTNLGAGLATAAAGTAGVGIGAAAGSRKKNAIAKNDPFEIHKLGSAKVRFQDITSYSQGAHSTTRHDSEQVSTRYKGKSLILRRPKYQVVAYPSDTKMKNSTHAQASPNYRIKGEAADAFVEANRKKSKTVKLGNKRFKHTVVKANAVSAFGIDHGH